MLPTVDGYDLNYHAPQAQVMQLDTKSVANGLGSVPKTDIGLEALYQILNGMDWAQTRFISRNPKGKDNPNGFYEKDSKFLIGAHPHKDKVDGFFAAKAIAHMLGTKYLSDDMRNIMNMLTIAPLANTIRNNHSIGIQMRF